MLGEMSAVAVTFFSLLTSISSESILRHQSTSNPISVTNAIVCENRRLNNENCGKNEVQINLIPQENREQIFGKANTMEKKNELEGQLTVGNNLALVKGAPKS